MVIKRFLRRVAGDGGVDLCTAHALPDIGIVGDGLERDMGHGPVFESTPDALVKVGQFVVVEVRRHEALLGQGCRHAGGVAGNPAAASLLGDVGCRAASAGWVEDQIPRIGGHQNTALNDLRIGLHDILLVRRESRKRSVHPGIRELLDRIVRHVSNVAKRVSYARPTDAPGGFEPRHAVWIGRFPTVVPVGSEDLTFELERRITARGTRTLQIVISENPRSFGRRLAATAFVL